MPSSYTTTSGVTLSRDAFITHYVAAWLAAESVYCTHRWPELDRLQTHPPVDKALCRAEDAWQQIEHIKP